MEDDRSRIEAENASVLHVILTPLRMLISFGKWVGLTALVLILVLVNQVGWVIDLGDRSQRARNARQNRLEAQINPDPGSQWSVFDVDFRTQPDTP